MKKRNWFVRHLDSFGAFWLGSSLIWSGIPLFSLKFWVIAIPTLMFFLLYIILNDKL
jgi:hypothetical protein